MRDRQAAEDPSPIRYWPVKRMILQFAGISPGLSESSATPVAEPAGLGMIEFVPPHASRHGHRYNTRMPVTYNDDLCVHRPHPNDISNLARGYIRR